MIQLRLLRLNKIKIFLFISLFLLISCGDITSPKKTGTFLINEILDDIELAVSLYEADTIIKHLHYDFLHNGRNKDSQSTIWLQRLLLYHTLSLEDRSIDIVDNNALVSFKMTFDGEQGTLVSQEPSEEYGDISYFVRENGKWFLIGNRF